MLNRNGLVILIALCLAQVLRVMGEDKAAGDDAAKQLFQKMEDQLAKAKTLKCNLEIHIEGTGEPGAPLRKVDFIGSLALAEGNRARLELRKTRPEPSDMPEVPFWLTISDGNRLLHQDSGMPKPTIGSVGAMDSHADIAAFLARSGIYPTTLPLPDVDVKKMKDRFPVSDCKLGPKEKVDGVLAQRLDYQFEVIGQKGPIQASVYIGVKGGLPLKRTSTWKLGGIQVMAIAETYKHLVADEKIDPEEFHLKKK
jgi:hypothetical protein